MLFVLKLGYLVNTGGDIILVEDVNWWGYINTGYNTGGDISIIYWWGYNIYWWDI